MNEALVSLAMLIVILGIIFGFKYCVTDAGTAKLKALGKSAHVICYSGGVKIYDGYSTGKVQSEENSDGYFFLEKGTSVPKEVSGNCIISYEGN